MSASLNLSPYQVKQLGAALEGFSKLTRETQVTISGRGGEQTLQIGDAHLEIRWNDNAREYEIDDRIGL